MSEEIVRGALYVVPTPIGNLEDITLRAIHVLKHVDVIAAEDTRTSKVLLDHYGIDRPLLSFFSHNEQVRVPQIIARLKEGETVAIISDAGTPGISDPAHSIVVAAITEAITIIPLPGPTAFVPALVASGFPTHAFVFEGFLPHKKGRQTRLKKLAAEERTIVLYESVHRIERTLRDLLEHLGDRPVMIGRELTKKFEQLIRGSLTSVLAGLPGMVLKGEFVLIVGGADSERPDTDIDPH